MDPKILTTHPISLCLWQWEKDIKKQRKCWKKAEWKVQSSQKAAIKSEIASENISLICYY